MVLDRRAKLALGRAALLLLFLGVLEIAGRTGLVSGLVLSPTSAIALKIWEDLQTAELWASLGTTATEFSIAFLISLTLGAGFGALFFSYRRLGLAAEPILLAFYAAPTILLYPVFLTLFGLGSMAVISMAVVFGSIPIIVNVSVGLAGVDPMVIKVGESLRATRGQMFWKIMIPAATPTIFTGLRLGFTYCLLGVIAVEFITFSGGLGKMVSWRYFIFDTDGLFSGIVFVVSIAGLMNSLLLHGEERIRKRRT